ncbi:hypothetical protein G7K_1027-t1 [Saitoella complicata NRRL Y-17804]|uniref:Secreted protein n=1 Tax=Saitoella complicata (strain BCRC 22490 / CBS 7301 / JCM 7358 / NBRC 10748 / NRRL Y-17804) TaxID=698492 RepID=A0A0E9NAE7_SAICN|nr:hypothetical protein G7K_1027-t1 [Saitoella complicata NRRL Y-17804]
MCAGFAFCLHFASLGIAVILSLSHPQPVPFKYISFWKWWTICSYSNITWTCPPISSSLTQSLHPMAIQKGGYHQPAT